MSALLNDALAGAGLQPAIERLEKQLKIAAINIREVTLEQRFTMNLIDLLTRCRDTLEQQAEALAEVPRWQPIETAPKDGSEILLGRAENEDLDQGGISVPGYWQTGYEDGVDYMGVDDGFVDSHHQTFSGGRSFGAVSHRYQPNQPTHWMPLPKEPS